MTYARVLIVVVLAGLLGVLVLAVDTAAKRGEQLRHTEHAIVALNDTIKEMQDRNDRTDRMLAATARDRQWIDQEATALARQLAVLQAGDHCLSARIPLDVVGRLYDYRDRTGGDPGAGAAGMDGSSASAAYWPTYGEYISAAERFAQQCNADRVSVREWSDAK